MLIPIGFLGALISKFRTRTIADAYFKSDGSYQSWVSTRKYLQARFGGGVNNLAHSTNGETWSYVAAPLGDAQSIAQNGSIIVMASGQNFFSSTDGITWTQRTGTTAGEIHRMFWDGSRFLATSWYTAQSSPTIYFSSAGTTWSGLSPFGSGLTNVYCIALQHNGSGTYIATRSGSTTAARICTSDPTVASNWSAITMPSTGVWAGLAFGNSTWVATRAGSTAYGTSTNGTTWTARTLPSNFSESTANLPKITFANGKFYYYYQDFVYSSADGITWEAESINGNTLDMVGSWIYDGSKLRGFGGDTITAAGGSNADRFIEGAI